MKVPPLVYQMHLASLAWISGHRRHDQNERLAAAPLKRCPAPLELTMVRSSKLTKLLLAGTGHRSPETAWSTVAPLPAPRIARLPPAGTASPASVNVPAARKTMPPAGSAASAPLSVSFAVAQETPSLPSLPWGLTWTVPAAAGAAAACTDSFAAVAVGELSCPPASASAAPML